MKKLFAFVSLALMLSASVLAQSSATAGAAATIFTPITISKNAGFDMNFGNLASSGTAGTCVLAPDDGRTTSGGVTIVAGGAPTAAVFTVTGIDGADYTITLPSGATTVSDGTNTMTIDDWTSTPDGSGTLTGGTSELRVGATLYVGINQPAGIYNTSNAGASGEFTVTVNYQ